MRREALSRNCERAADGHRSGRHQGFERSAAYSRARRSGQSHQPSPVCQRRTHSSKPHAPSPGAGMAPTSAIIHTSPRRGPVVSRSQNDCPSSDPRTTDPLLNVVLIRGSSGPMLSSSSQSQAASRGTSSTHRHFPPRGAAFPSPETADAAALLRKARRLTAGQARSVSEGARSLRKDSPGG